MATVWVQALAALPPKLRLEVQKGVAQDIIAQRDMAPQPPLSRAYCSGDSDKHQPKSGLGVGEADVLGVGKRFSGPGHHVAAVSRQFPSTATILAEMLIEAVKMAKASPRVPFGLGSASEDGGAEVSSQVTVQALASEIRALHLDDAYRVTLARYLQRSLGGSGGTTDATKAATSPAWAEEAGLHPDRFAHLSAASDGTLAAQVQAVFERGQALLSSTSSKAPVSLPKGQAGVSAAVAATSDDLDALLDEAMDEFLN